jgi:hypothetical protein
MIEQGRDRPSPPGPPAHRVAGLPRIRTLTKSHPGGVLEAPCPVRVLAGPTAPLRHQRSLDIWTGAMGVSDGWFDARRRGRVQALAGTCGGLGAGPDGMGRETRGDG